MRAGDNPKNWSFEARYSVDGRPGITFEHGLVDKPECLACGQPYRGARNSKRCPPCQAVANARNSARNTKKKNAAAKVRRQAAREQLLQQRSVTA